jgi:hypothetical protein
MSVNSLQKLVVGVILDKEGYSPNCKVGTAARQLSQGAIQRLSGECLYGGIFRKAPLSFRKETLNDELS